MSMAANGWARRSSGEGSRRAAAPSRCLVCLLAALLLCVFSQQVLAQGLPAQAPVQQTPAQQGVVASTPPSLQTTDNKHIAERPYDPIFTKPQFPSTPMQQKQFTLQYVYNYAESTYTPAVPLATVAKSTVKFNTPENALIALYSSMRNADFDGFLNCWDEPSRASLENQVKASAQFKQKLMANWKTMLADKPILLTHRLDTVNYILLDAVIQNVYGPGKPFEDTEVLVFEKGRWVFSNQFGTDGLITQHEMKAQGDKVTYDFDLRPLLPEPGPGTAANHAQQEFLKAHNKTSVVTQTVE